MQSLRATSEEHHARLMPHVDNLLILAEMIGRVECTAIHATFEDEYTFIQDELVPHMAAVEGALYQRLEQLMDGRHSMAPMRAEHQGISRLIEELGRYRRHSEDCTWGELEGIALRRVLYRLHSMLKMHLAEEELYLGVLERSLSDEEKDVLAHGLEHAGAGTP